MQCRNCNTALIPGKTFCPACGHDAARSCSGCGAPIRSGFRFCPDCGTEIHADEPPGDADPRLARLAERIPAALAAKIQASRSLTGERKLVTVLYCDLVGSTALAERLGPEEYRDLLDEYLAVAFREISRAEGIVNQLAGDGLMALFGAPIAHEDSPDRAVHSALAIRGALEELRARLRRDRGLELQVRIGVHTGPVVVGTIGNDLKMDYTAIGDTTNLGARLQAAAEPGAILISEATHRLVLGRFRVEAAGPFDLEGKREPVRAFRVISRRDRATPMAIAVARGLTPLAGRAVELEHLQACFRGLQRHWTQVVAVVGDAGSGKSRLLYEFKQQLRPEPVVFLEGRCSSLDHMVPYAAVANMLRGYFDLGADGSPQELRDKVGRKLASVDRDLAAVCPTFCRLLAAPVDAADTLPAEERKRETFDAVARLVMSASRLTPVVMILEDIQWIDESSRELLQVAVSRLQTARVMLAVSHRPDYDLPWRTQAAFTRLTLRRLGDEEITAILRSLAGGALPAELEERIRRRAEGTPFFAEELTRALTEQGYIVRANGEVRLTRPVEEILIPNTVQELIGARVDRLGAAGKRIVQIASVLGRQFRRDQLARLLDVEGVDLAAELNDLEGRGVIHRKNVLSDDEFRFGESLTQEVAYEGLLLRERRQLHGRIARMLERATDERTAERSTLIAHHYTRSGDPRNAIAALLAAATAAETLPSYATAVDHFLQAWELAEAALAETDDPQMRAWALDATYGLSRLTILYGSPATIDVDLVARRACELADAHGDTKTLALVSSLRGMHTMGSSRESFAVGLQMVEDALSSVERAGLSGPAISISRALAFGYVLDGRFDAARARIAAVMTALDASGERDRLADVYFGACWVRDTIRLYGDDLPAAERGARETYELAMEAHNRTAEAGMSAKLSYLYVIRGDYESARTWARRCLQTAEEIANMAAMLTAAAVELVAGAALGDHPTRYVGVVDDVLRRGSHILLNARLVVEALLAVGEIQRAERAAELAYRRAGGRLREALSTVALGDALRARGPAHWEAAQRWYTRARSVAADIGARSALVGASLGLAELARTRGNAGRVHSALAGIPEGCERLGLGRDGLRVRRLLEG